MNYIEMQNIIDSLQMESKKTVKHTKKRAIFDHDGNLKRDYKERIRVKEC